MRDHQKPSIKDILDALSSILKKDNATTETKPRSFIWSNVFWLIVILFALVLALTIKQ